jgi:hypothetical protein
MISSPLDIGYTKSPPILETMIAAAAGAKIGAAPGERAAERAATLIADVRPN